MRSKWAKTAVIVIDVLLACYIVAAFTVFNKPDEKSKICTKVNIDIADETSNGFINKSEIEHRLKQTGLDPSNKPVCLVSTQQIENMLKRSAFVRTAQCYKTQGGDVNIILTQRMPIVRIMSNRGEDYYLDDNHQIMPNTKYTSNLIIATGNINHWFARNYISNLSAALMASNLWRNQIEQINILPDYGVELVPRVGRHIVYLGQVPFGKNDKERKERMYQFVYHKMDRLEKFYKYGLSQAGWNKYSYIDLEFDNQIICTKRPEAKATPAPQTAETQTE